MSLRVLLHAPASAPAGSLVELRATAAHAMETGYRRGSDGQMLPRDLLRRIEARFDGELFFSAELHAAIAANPTVAFWLRLPGSGTLSVRFSGDRGLAHEEHVRIAAT
ncbi:MAG: thiosulfate oxidation carrier complex protein SoxZ [Rubrivivax sp.]|nr:thiosulfate oxidation carrier complex protein SoxZ [Rubrivivax sp.]